MKKNMYRLIALFFALGMFTFSCDEVSLDQPELDLETSQDNALTERASGDIFGVVNSGTGVGKAIGDCPAISFDLLDKVMTITYPSEGCMGNDGIVRAGVITATFANFGTGWAVGSTVTITFTDYTLDGNELTGTMVGVCTALLPYPTFSLSSNNMVLTFDDQRTISWRFEDVFSMTGGFMTPGDRTDDAWIINGVTEGTARNGKTFYREVIDLTTSNDCKYFVSGVINLTIGETDEYKLEFKEPCGTVEFTYKGFTIQQTLN